VTHIAIAINIFFKPDMFHLLINYYYALLWLIIINV